MSHVTHMNESRHADEWVLSCICYTSRRDINTTCHSHEWVRSVTHINESCLSHTWICRGDPIRNVLQCVALYYSVLQCVAVCCSVLQCVADMPCLSHAWMSPVCHIRKWGGRGESPVTYMNQREWRRREQVLVFISSEIGLFAWDGVIFFWLTDQGMRIELNRF